MPTRRDFLQKSALTTAGSLLIPNFLKAYELDRMGLPPTGQKIVVVVQLSGGNDGLNTVVPYRNDIYYRERPTIAIRPEKVLTLTDELGLNPALEAIRPLYDDGQMTIINNVGYPNPDRSHFRSMDIWHTASDSNQYVNTGWVGRYLDAQCKGAPSARAGVPYRALEVDDTLSLSMKGDAVNGLAVLDPKKLYNQTRSGLVKGLSAATPASTPEHDQVAYLYKTLAETVSSAEHVYDKAKTVSTPKLYPASELGSRLKTVSELIQSGLETSVYYVSIGSFDTHINQPGQQERLLRQYAEAVRAFMDDMKRAGRTQDVLLMTFSEFGRRVKQNASNGTDHGTASNVLLFGGNGAGPATGSRVINAAPNLTDLDEGDLKYTVDFRSIYATLLRDWLKADDEAILGRRFDRLPIV
ncbi:DUF1501 domain-containing protein [Rudanella paleaurantiibacter]|uniref:DUF1501 domain-containing protein n=1 Tax=Rudanella paleaurantiibacter TaxID=2614655 RepID=A0A7J5U2C1_9BACT|nr:DUF1501 domain-containing protein [Rudanella paleaurantiibacter]KAB7731949.1 DUF1501 domain-containing protein [Rudanella paleaurantiibacter]